MSKTMYKTTIFDEIVKVVVERETKASVWIKEVAGANQYRKRCDSWNFFDTFEEAKCYLIDKYEKAIAQLENQLNHKTQVLDKINGFKNE